MATTAVSALSLLLSLLAFLLAATGILLLVRGARRRIGHVPHCRACEYNLTGIESRRCPECGAALDAPRAIVRGERRRSRVSIWLGWLALFFSVVVVGMIGFGVFQRLDLYRFVPTSVLAGWMNGGDARGATRAFVELNRRYTSGALSAGGLARFADACIAEQGGPVVRGILTDMATDAVGSMIVANQLDETRLRKACESMLRLELHTRPQIAAGDRIPLVLHETTRVPSSVWAKVEWNEIRADGEVVSRGSTSNSSRGSVGSTTSRRTIAPLETGSHDVSTGIRITLFLDRGASAFDESEPIYEKDLTLDADAVVVDGPVTSGPRPVRSAQLDDAVLRSVVRVLFRPVEPKSEKDPREFDVQVHLDAPAASGAAFELVIPGYAPAYRAPCLVAVAPSSGQTVEHRFRQAEEGGGALSEIVLRASRQAAAETVDIEEYWGGTLLLTPRSPHALSIGSGSEEWSTTQPAVDFDIRVVDEWPEPTAPGEQEQP